MRLVLFDVDGTLTRTSGVDAVCFARALDEALGIADASTDWETYEHTTDSYITRALIRDRLGHEASEEDLERFRRRFMELLEAAWREDPGQFREVPGAGAALERLREASDWMPALATGGWRVSARMKLAKAGVEADGLAMASADDGLSRESILRTAIGRALRAAGVEGFDRTVYVGDGVWDVRTTRAMGIPIIAVAADGQGDRLAAEGATVILADLADHGRLVEAMEKAAVARRP